MTFHHSHQTVRRFADGLQPQKQDPGCGDFGSGREKEMKTLPDSHGYTLQPIVARGFPIFGIEENHLPCRSVFSSAFLISSTWSGRA
jgi:hypothetical protein